MKKIVDLSHPITAGMPVFPGDPAVCVAQIHTISGTGYNVSEFTMGTHTGTHVDAPRHAIHSDHAVDSISMDTLVGWAEVLDLTKKPLGKEITTADLDEFTPRITEGSRILLRTDWSKRFGTPDFFTDYPGISEGAVAWLKGRKVKLIAVEQPSVDIGEHTEVHKAILSLGIVIIESIANLHSLTQDRVYFAALPLNLVGLDGSPVRAIAVEGVEIGE